MKPLTPERLAQLFHENYERLAPEYGYETRVASAVPWDELRGANRALMIATARCVLEATAGPYEKARRASRRP